MCVLWAGHARSHQPGHALFKSCMILQQNRFVDSHTVIQLWFWFVYKKIEFLIIIFSVAAQSEEIWMFYFNDWMTVILLNTCDLICVACVVLFVICFELMQAYYN